MEKNQSFEDIFSLLQDQDVRNGTFFITKYKPKIFKHNFARVLLFTGLVLEFFFCTSAFFGEDLLLFILELIVVILYATFVSSVIFMKVKSGDTKNIFNFCHEIYDIEQKFHEKFQDIARKHVNIAHERARNLIKFIVIVFYLDTIIMVPISATIRYFLPDSISPKYSLPVPFGFIFFKNRQATPLAFYFTITAQSICSLQISIGAALLYSVVFAFILHVFAYLDIINEVIEMLNGEIKKHVNICYENKSKANFDMTFWIKTVVDMTSVLKEAMQSFSAVFSGFLLLSEMAAFGAFIACGMVFLVLKKQYFLGIGITVASMLFFLLCYVNEKIVTKLSNIRFNLYDIDWYCLQPKEAKMLLIALNVNQLGIGFSASGIHDLTLDRFATVAKAAYSNCLILKDILTK